jgi:hypothetical protein
MKKIVNDIGLIRKHQEVVSGVFTLADLAVLMDEPYKTGLYRRIEGLQEENILRRFARGVYITAVFSPLILSRKLRENSCISFGNVLAEARVIGSVPKYQIDAISPGKSAMFSCDDITIRYFGVADYLVFGFEYRKGVRIALPEKALLDTLYFYQHGARFFFDVFSDVNISMLDRDRLDRFLANYKNPKFKAFATGYLHGNP